jgi:hypothetical protein
MPNTPAQRRPLTENPKFRRQGLLLHNDSSHCLRLCGAHASLFLILNVCTHGVKWSASRPDHFIPGTDWIRGHAMEGRGIDSRWCNWNFSLI